MVVRIQKLDRDDYAPLIEAPLNAMLRTIKAITRIRSRTASLLTNILGPTTDINIEQSRRTAVTESWASQASRKELRVDNVPGASFDSSTFSLPFSCSSL